MPGLACQFEDGKNAVFVGTFLESGTSITACEDHLIDFVVSLSEQLTGAPVITFVADHQQASTDDLTPVELTDDELEQAAWLEEHREAIQAVQDAGATFEEAIAAVIEAEDELEDSAADSEPATN
jgi:hypothetical protein